MADDTQAKLAAALARTPDWLRQDLLSKDGKIRARAEEALSTALALVATSCEATVPERGAA